MKYLLRTAGVVLAVFLLLVIASWVWIATFDLQAHRARIEVLASQALGRDVHIDGPLSLKPSLFPRISIENVRIANTDWATQPDFLVVEQLEVEISLKAFLYNTLVIQDIELNGATLHLQRGPDQAVNWVFKSGTIKKSASGVIPDVVGFHAKRVLIMMYPVDRPPVGITIDEMRASLTHDEPVVININSTISDLPLNLELQGGTLSEILDREARWPIKGTLDTDVRKIDFEGYITDLVAFKEVKLRVSSEKQTPHDSLLFGRSYQPMIDRYRFKLGINRNDDIYTFKLSGVANGFDLSRMYQPQQRSQKPSLKFRNFEMDARSSGHTLSDVFQAVTFDAQGTGIEFQYPIGTPGQDFYTAQIDTLRAKSIPGKGIEFSLKGTANHIPARVRVSVKNLLYGLWLSKDVPLDLEFQSKAADARFSGKLSKAHDNITLEGNVSMRADKLESVGEILGQHWPESAPLQATSQVSIADGSLTISNILGQLGKQKASGEVALTYDDALNLSIKTHADRFDLHHALQADKLPANLAFNLNGLDLAIQGKNQSLKQCVLAGTWEISAKQGKVGWQSKPADNKYVFALHDIRLSTSDNEPISLSAKSLHNGQKLELDAQVGRLEELLDTAIPYPLNVQLSGDGLAGSFQGALQKPLADIALAGDLEVNGSVSAIAHMFNLKLTQQQPAKLHGHLALKRKDIKLTDVVATTSGIALYGDAHYQAALSPHLVINSTGSSIDLAPYMKIKIKPDKKAEKQTSRRSRIVPDTPFDFGKYRALDAVVNLKELGIKHEDAAIIMINGRISADKGRFRLDPLETRSAIDNSTTLARLELDGTSHPARVKYNLQANNLDYGEYLKRFEITDEITGTIDLRIDLNAEGNSLHDLMSTANGDIRLVANKGMVPKWLLEIWGSGLLRILIPTTWMEEPVTDLNCAVGSFTLADGSMRSQTLLADTKRVTVAGEVVIDWRDEKIRGLFKPQPKDAALLHVGTPIKLSGTLASPKFESAESGLVTLGKWAIGLTYPAALIVMFGDIGATEKNPCAALLKENEAMKEKAGHD
jgi:uncharacterized protein involved in outer membrane biogenesis